MTEKILLARDIERTKGWLKKILVRCKHVSKGQIHIKVNSVVISIEIEVKGIKMLLA